LKNLAYFQSVWHINFWFGVYQIFVYFVGGFSEVFKPNYLLYYKA